MEEKRAKQIPTSAWNKIRLAEMKIVDRLTYPSWEYEQKSMLMKNKKKDWVLKENEL